MEPGGSEDRSVGDESGSRSFVHGDAVAAAAAARVFVAFVHTRTTRCSYMKKNRGTRLQSFSLLYTADVHLNIYIYIFFERGARRLELFWSFPSATLRA